MKTQFVKIYDEIISLENLFSAWQEFVCGKRSKKDVQNFSLHLSDNILQLNNELANFSYRHGGYQAFNISDPKPRNIHKATVRDRILHHAIYRQLYPFFDNTFIASSYSCRIGKGTHKALKNFMEAAQQVSKNNTKTAWVLKCDIKKFFASIDHKILLDILASYIPDQKILWLLKEVIQSFSLTPGKGLPLGNLTSQLFCNVYMNELDQFVKHELKIEYYIRYADDFILMSKDRDELSDLLPRISDFLHNKLSLALHPHKIFVETLYSGVDFLGWINFPCHKVLRNTTRKRMFRRLKEHSTDSTLQSYLGLLSHGNAFKVKQEILNNYWLNKID